MSNAEPKVAYFHEVFTHGIDDSRRVMLPAKWRPKDPGLVFRVLPWPVNVEECLLVLPPERWDVMMQKLKMNRMQDRRVAALERVLGGTSAALTLDKVGRLCLPENLAKAAALEKEAVFVGRLDKFEIWSPARHKDSTIQDKILAASVVEEVDL
jgi:division/cell wall cluster transcriptional repressor MraZ